MKENMLEIVSNFGPRFWKRSVTQNMPKVKHSNKSDEFFCNLGISWLPHYARGFFLSSKQVKILNEPGSFYEFLLKKIKNANKRVVLASLYLGTGTLERSLVAALSQRLSEKPELSVRVLLDCIRGSRGEVNSRKLLLPLLENHEKSCQVSLFHTPVLREPFLSVLPERYKELAGLQHIKVYLIDNDFIISGANLSSDYFTNRQDRYIVINDSKELADFVGGLVEKVSEFSFQLDATDNLRLHPKWEHHPVKSKLEIFVSEARSLLNNYYENFVTTKEGDYDTVIFPLIEMGPFNIHMDSSVTTRILEGLEAQTNVHLTTGYFNLPDVYTNSIIDKSEASFNVLMAHPTANGFYNAKGPAGGIPFGYTLLASQFLNRVNQTRQNYRIKISEYIRPGWTYHAKGLWVSRGEKGLPFMTMIGSPNFGERSLSRDLECQFLIATDNEELQRDLLQEKDSLFSQSVSFTESVVKEETRVPPTWVKIVVRYFRTFF